MAGRAEPLEPEARAAAARPQARRPRPGLRQGPLLRPRHQGPEVPLGLAQDARRLRGRPDADLHAARQAARLDVEGRDADRPVPHVHAARQRARPRARFDAGDEVTPELAEGEGPDPLDPEVDVKILGNGDLTKKLTVTRTASRRPRARRSRPPAARSRCSGSRRCRSRRTGSAGPRAGRGRRRGATPRQPPSREPPRTSREGEGA